MKKLSSTYLKLSVAPENGADATTYWLVPSTTQVKRKADGTHTPEYVSCEAMSKTGNGNPVAGIGTIKFTLTDKTGSSSTEFLYASRIVVTSDMASITFKQYVGGSVVDTKTVTVVDDGQNGGEGSPGPVGPLVYPAGKYDDSIPYTRTPLSAPMVLCEKLYYLLNKEGTFTGINPKEDYAANGKKGTWVYMEKVEFAFYEILMANFAKLASAVFWGDYMFSQHGKDANGNDTIDFGLFDPSKIGQNNCPFTPNLMMDFLKGMFRIGDKFIAEMDENGKINVVVNGKFATSDTGERFEIDPVTRTLSYYDSLNRQGIKISGGASNSGSIEINGARSPSDIRKTYISGDKIEINAGENALNYLELLVEGISGNLNGKQFTITNDTYGSKKFTIYSNNWATSPDQVNKGGVYVENGFLKVKP